MNEASKMKEQKEVYEERNDKQLPFGLTWIFIQALVNKQVIMICDPIFTLIAKQLIKPTNSNNLPAVVTQMSRNFVDNYESQHINVEYTTGI